MLENVLQRYLAENFSIILKELPRRTVLGNLCDGALIIKIAAINSRLATSVKKKLPPRLLTSEYFRTFRASTGGSCMTSAFLIKLRVVYYRAAALLRRWSTNDFFLKKRLF